MNKLKEEVDHVMFRKLWEPGITGYPTPVGYLAAVVKKGENKVRIGYSLVKPNSGDQFNKELGRQIAVGRALTDRKKSLHQSLEHVMISFHNQVSKYFKDKQIPELNELIGNKES